MNYILINIANVTKNIIANINGLQQSSHRAIYAVPHRAKNVINKSFNLFLISFEIK